MNGNNKIAIEQGGTNVYADLGYADAAEIQRKSQLAAAQDDRRSGASADRQD